MWLETCTGVMINMDHARFMHMQPAKEENQWAVIITLDEEVRCGYADGTWSECKAHMDMVGSALGVHYHTSLTPFQMKPNFIPEENDDI